MTGVFTFDDGATSTVMCCGKDVLEHIPSVVVVVVIYAVRSGELKGNPHYSPSLT